MKSREDLFKCIENTQYWWEIPNTIVRKSDLPLDANSVFCSIDSLCEYIKSSTSTSYPGQIVTVVGEDGGSTSYVIQEDKTYKELPFKDYVDTCVGTAKDDLSGCINSVCAELCERIDSSHTELSCYIDTVCTTLCERVDASHTELSGCISYLSGCVEALTTYTDNNIQELSGCIDGVCTTLSGCIEAQKTYIDKSINGLRDYTNGHICVLHENILILNESLIGCIETQKTYTDKCILDLDVKLSDCIDTNIGTLTTRINDLSSLKLEVYVPDTGCLPPVESGCKHCIYLIPKKTQEDGDFYDEYIFTYDEYNNGRYEKVGDTKVCLCGYAKCTDVDDKICALKIEETYQTQEAAHLQEDALKEYISTCIGDLSCCISASHIELSGCINNLDSRLSGCVDVINNDITWIKGTVVPEIKGDIDKIEGKIEELPNKDYVSGCVTTNIATSIAPVCSKIDSLEDELDKEVDKLNCRIDNLDLQGHKHFIFDSEEQKDLEESMNNGDTAIVKTLIPGTEDKYSYTGYVYDDESEEPAWKPLDGNYRAEDVYLSGNIYFTKDVGVISVDKCLGYYCFDANGLTVDQFLCCIFTKAEDPTVTQPTISVKADAMKSYEVGTCVTIPYTINTTNGSYEYGAKDQEDKSCTGVTWDGYTATFNGETKTGKTGTFNYEVEETETPYITVSATYDDGLEPCKNIPGLTAPELKIIGCTLSKNSSPITGYRAWFWGYGTEDFNTQITSGDFRDEYNPMPRPSGSSYTIKSPSGIKHIVFAAPTGCIKSLTVQGPQSVWDSKKVVINIEGENHYTGIDYDVFYTESKEPNKNANDYQVSWT